MEEASSNYNESYLMMCSEDNDASINTVSGFKIRISIWCVCTVRAIYNRMGCVEFFGEHRYEFTDCSERKFVGIRITRDDEHNYVMDQYRMIDDIVYRIQWICRNFSEMTTPQYPSRKSAKNIRKYE